MKIDLNLYCKFLVACILSLFLTLNGQSQTSLSFRELPFMNSELPLKVRIDDLVSMLTLEEKILQMQHTAPAIGRLGIPQYNW